MDKSDRAGLGIDTKEQGLSHLDASGLLKKIYPKTADNTGLVSTQ